MANTRRDRLAELYHDPGFNDRPLYHVADAVLALRQPPSTLRWWLQGRAHHPAVIELAEPHEKRLSFRNLCELWVLQSLRRQHRVPLQRIRQALDEIRRRTGLDHPLVEQELLTDGQSVIFEQFGQIIDAGRGGQTLFEASRPYLDRVTWDRDDLARLFPIATNEPEADRRRIVVDPRLAFGRPCLASSGIPVEVFAPRFLAGEGILSLAEEFGCSTDEVQDALRFLAGKRLAA